MQRTRAATNNTEWILLAAVLALSFGAVRPSIRGNDGVGHYVYLASLLRGGDLDFADEYRLYDNLRQYPYKFSELPRSPETGRPSNRYGVGAALLWSPFVLTVHGALKLTGSPLADGVSRPYEWAVGLGTAFWAGVGLALLYGRLRRMVSPLCAAAILAGLVFATPLGFYMYGHGSMSHGVSFFAAAALLLAFERAWEAPAAGRYALCGAFAGLLVMIRMQDATWAAVIGCALAARGLMRNEESEVKELKKNSSGFWAFGGFGLAFFLVFLPQLFVWRSLYGSFLSGPMPYLDRTAGFFSPWPVHFFEALFSARHGVLTWHPLIAIALAGMLPSVNLKSQSAIRNPQSAILYISLAGFLAQLGLVSCWSMWWAGASFGNRFFISSLPFLALGLARVALLMNTSRRRAGALLILALLIAWNMGLLVQYATEMIPREDWVPWSRIIRQNLVDVPRLVLSRLTGR